MNGFININKPAGITSFDVIRELRKRLQIKRMGHLGTLDPEATGVLPVAVGYATRLISYLEDEDKCYRSRGRLGTVSSTQDKTGELTIINPKPEVNQIILQAELKRLTGIIMQKPPMYSAVHYQGRRLYELARAGITVDVPARQVNIYRLDLLGMGFDDMGIWVDLEIECSRGAYIRTIWHDLGQALGCGAYMEDLQRIRVGSFQIDDAVDLNNVTKAAILPMDKPFAEWNEIMVRGLLKKRIRNGNPVTMLNNDLVAPGKLLIKGIDGELLALGEADVTGIKPSRVIAQNEKG